MTLKARVASLVGVLLGLLLIMSLLSLWATSRMGHKATEALDRLRDAGEVRDVLTTMAQQYQAQADFIINEKADTREFEEAGKAFDAAEKNFAKMADTPEEKAWAAELERVDH